MVELFLNGEYFGIYMLGEKVDRKLHDLSKHTGVMYKAINHDGSLKKDGHSGFEQIYPKKDTTWLPMEKLRAFIMDSSDEDFAEHIAEKVDIDNAIDFFILMMITSACDNITKNYYISRHSTESLFFFTPWDMDGSFGRSWDGSRKEDFNPMGRNLLFKRLRETNAENYVDRLKTRWNDLKKGILSADSLKKKFETYKEDLIYSGAVERDKKRWPDRETFEDDVKYIKLWIDERFELTDKRLLSF